MRKTTLAALSLTLASLVHTAPKTHAKVSSTEVSKVGYTNVEYFIHLLPEFKKVEAELQTFEKQVKRQVDTKLQELQKKLQDFQKSSEKLSQAVKSQRQAELQKLYEDIEQFKHDVQKKLTQKQTDLIEPLYNKVQKTIEQVATKHGYTCVINTHAGGMPIVLYTAPQHDISDLVLKQLGVDPKKLNPTQKKVK